LKRVYSKDSFARSAYFVAMIRSAALLRCCQTSMA
jgi:hypothetical protein